MSCWLSRWFLNCLDQQPPACRSFPALQLCRPLPIAPPAAAGARRQRRAAVRHRVCLFAPPVCRRPAPACAALGRQATVAPAGSSWASPPRSSGQTSGYCRSRGRPSGAPGPGLGAQAPSLAAAFARAGVAELAAWAALVAAGALPGVLPAVVGCHPAAPAAAAVVTRPKASRYGRTLREVCFRAACACCAETMVYMYTAAAFFASKLPVQ